MKDGLVEQKRNKKDGYPKKEEKEYLNNSPNLLNYIIPKH